MNESRMPWRSFEEMLASRSATPSEQQRHESMLSQIRHDEERREKARLARVALARQNSELGPRFNERTLEAYLVPPGDGRAKARAIEIANELSSGGWFFGPPGVGKTHLSAGIILAAVSRGIPAAFTTALGLLDRLRDSFEPNGRRLRGGEYDIVDGLSRVEVLVLDDLDKVEFSNRSKWAAQRIYALINRRYEQRLPLIVTTNVTPAELVLNWRTAGLDDLIGNAIIDRMREMCTHFVRVDGSSYRALGRAQ